MDLKSVASVFIKTLWRFCVRMQDEYSCDVNKLPAGVTLRNTVNAIRQMGLLGKDISEVRSVHTEFCKQYPKLVDKLLEPDMNTEQLQYLLSMFDKVQQKNTTYEQASKVVGQTMFDKFVAPDLSPDQLERVQAKVRELETHSPEELAQAAAQLGQSAASPSATRAQPNATPPTSKGAGGNKKKLRKQRERHESQ